MAKQLNVDLLPIISYGAGKALPKKGKYLRKWPVRIEIDQRQSPDAMLTYGHSPRAQATNMRKYYKQRLGEIANRMEQNV